MSDPTNCKTCRFWSLLREGALIGRCTNVESSGAQFPRGSHCCGWWEGTTPAKHDLGTHDTPHSDPIQGRDRPKRR